MAGSRSGFFVNDTASLVTGIGTSYDFAKKIKLQSGAGVPVSQGPAEAPAAGFARWSHIELVLENAASVTAAEATVYWDEACTEIAAGPSQVASSVVATSVANNKATTMGIDISPTFPTSPTVDRAVWVVLKLTGGTGDCKLLRMHWHEQARQ